MKTLERDDVIEKNFSYNNFNSNNMQQYLHLNNNNYNSGPIDYLDLRINKMF
jgi:hypothetical protein